jgi:hypothetical protein
VIKEKDMATTTTAVGKPNKVKGKPVSQSYWSLVWWKFKKNRAAVVGGIALILLYFSFVAIPEFIPPTIKILSTFTEARPQPIRFIDERASSTCSRLFTAGTANRPKAAHPNLR